MFPLAEIDAPLPTVAPTDESTLAPFAHILSALLEKGVLPSQPLDDIALSCVAYGLNRICLDAATQQAFIAGAGAEWGSTDVGASGWGGEAAGGRKESIGLGGNAFETRHSNDERSEVGKVSTPVYPLPVPAYKIQ